MLLITKHIEMLIFNRWGEKMFETTDLSKGWDGNYLGNQHKMVYMRIK
jgi:trimeric autotransporter adhesin